MIWSIQAFFWPSPNSKIKCISWKFNMFVYLLTKHACDIFEALIWMKEVQDFVISVVIMNISSS